ncbi:MAG: DUF4214 domain-containing protein [Clostridiales bacterium]|nr:DUF4214 domain-containing protein [Clostridiales bacterium]MDY3746001.1 DUF4214 domain-containing protein [Lachnospiraceae bacterium]
MKRKVISIFVLLCVIFAAVPNGSWAAAVNSQETAILTENTGEAGLDEAASESYEADPVLSDTENEAYETKTGINETENESVEAETDISETANEPYETETTLEETESSPENEPSAAEPVSVENDTEEDLSQKYSNEGVYKFVERLYNIALHRQPDAAGIDDWYHQLIDQKATGAKVAYGFIFSHEFLAGKLDDSQYVDVLYKVFLNRLPDEAGKKSWMERLSSSVSRLSVFNGFTKSNEFHELCKAYGIEAGFVDSTDICDQNDDITMFVHRCYEKFLGRKPDKAGLNAWVGQLLSGDCSPQRAAYGFVFSQEFISKNSDDQTFVTTLYRGLFNREPDAQGLDAWLSVLKTEKTRLYVFKGFAFSNEFESMIQKFGLTMGNDSLSDIKDYNYLLNYVRAGAYLAYDENNDCVVYEKNAGKVMQLASQTKLMTALVVLDHVSDLNAQVQMTDEANRGLTWETVRAGLVNGKYYTIQTLLEGMLVYSGADCANLLALYVAGSIDSFVQMMNDKAQSLGMTDTYFSDPVGLYDNHSTALQYIKLALAARNNAVINRITAMPYCEITDVDGGSYRKLQNGNAMVAGYLDYDKNLYTVDGMKTGTTDQAGYCLTTSSYDSTGSRVITVVLNTVSHNQRGIDSRYLLDAIYGNHLKGYYSLARPF